MRIPEINAQHALIAKYVPLTGAGVTLTTLIICVLIKEINHSTSLVLFRFS